ncbi:MAG: DUF2891 domain-containing protein [Flavobacteriaceae bacterium]|jgi:hypothetical protein|nr:DUF2891 domain-containing protein [Flavobacteriaceae bacterium]
MNKVLVLVAMAVLTISCTTKQKQETAKTEDNKALVLTIKEAQKIIDLPLHCIEQEYPNKLGQVLGKDEDLKTPKQLRPIFYGCFDWHSSVHGFWSIVTLLKQFPELDKDNQIRTRLNQLITEENCKVEQAFFEDPDNRTFERTYGWAWLFQLHGALLQWEDPDAQRWAKIIEPLANKLVNRYQEYLPKLVYPIRTGTHDNTAFGLSLSLEYARQQNLKEFEHLIVSTSKRLYEKDTNCNLAFEPSGHDFLSPCLEEARLMSKIMDDTTYTPWLKQFLPALFQPSFSLEVAKVSDRTDGHLVHLDGLNFSRATCLSDIAKKVPELTYLSAIGHKHFTASFGNITNDDYMGSHWLGTFALYTLLHQ